MGNALISIHATGAHHNGRSDDIEQMAAAFVQDLKDAGHNVTAATIVTGGENDLLGEQMPLAEHKPG